MSQHQIILSFNDGRVVPSVLTPEVPSLQKAVEGMQFYKADSFSIVTFTTENTKGESMIFHETYKAIIVEKQLDAYAKKHGKNIHHNGTHNVVSYITEKDEDCLFLTLDFEDDYLTPKFYVTRLMDDDIESHDTFEKAWEDFSKRLIEQGVKEQIPA